MSEVWGPFQKKPNILILMTDQERTEQHWPEGWAETHLPWLTYLKRHGVTFNRGMCSSSACSPSRSALFTSTYPTVNGVLKVGGTLSMSRTLPMGGSLTSLGHVMANAGYEVAYKGKWHLDGSMASYANMRPEDLARILIEDDAMLQHYGMPRWTSPDLGDAEQITGSDPVATGHNTVVNSIGGGKMQNDRRVVHGPMYDPENQKSAVEFLEDYDPTCGKPFCLIVSLANPHDIWVNPYSMEEAGYCDDAWLGPDYEPFELPPNMVVNPKSKPKAQNDWLVGFQGGPLCSDDRLPYVKFYAYLQTLIDELMGDVIETLQKRGLEDDTLIVRLADHGEQAMSQGGQRGKENVVYNETILVPTIYANPRLAQGATSESLVGLIDVIPTLAEIVGQDPAAGGATIQGTSYAGEILDPTGPGRDHMLWVTDDGSFSNYTSIRALVGREFKYAVYYEASYDGDLTSILNYNGEVSAPSSSDSDSDSSSKKSSGSPVQYELYDYTEEDGWLETDNKLSDPGTITDEALIERWKELHAALTTLMTESHTLPNQWDLASPEEALAQTGETVSSG